MEKIAANEDYKKIFSLADRQGIVYHGPQVGEELHNLRLLVIELKDELKAEEP